MTAPGSVFVELFVPEIGPYVALFRDVLGFTLVDDDGDFAKLESQRGLVLLQASTDLPADHPFADLARGGRRGLGVEIGVAVSDLRAAWTRAKTLPDCTVSDIVPQEWGTSDFRIVTREGYYLRVSDPSD